MEKKPKLRDVSYGVVKKNIDLIQKTFNPQDPYLGRMADYNGAEDEEELGLFDGYCPYCSAGPFKKSSEVEDHLEDGSCDQYYNWLDLQDRSSRDD